MTGPRAEAEAGFTFAELLIAFAVAAIVLAGAMTAFQVGTRALEFGVGQAAAQQTARAALERMATEIRWAGYGHENPDTATYGFTAIANQTPTGLTLQNDFNGNGVIDAPAGPCDATAVTEQVQYQLLGTDLMRSDNPNDPDCNVAVASGITGLTFRYFNSARQPPENPAAIRTVDITMKVTAQDGPTQRTIVMRDQIRFRNR
jgi:Tfp pilus assembly protein PilW